MSGLEVLLVVGVGVAVTAGVRKARKDRKQKKLAAHGTAQLVPEESNRATSSQPRQGKIVEEEPLPLYSPPSKELLVDDNKPPAYDTARSGDESNNIPGATTDIASTTENATEDGPAAISERMKKEKSHRWKAWRRGRSDKSDATIQSGGFETR
ncbi:hypothetical protein LTS08_003576 [Lithohypha guttulata]|nr:hypothetical protein LTS08_003576 [Lithohypha guttulata]